MASMRTASLGLNDGPPSKKPVVHRSRKPNSIQQQETANSPSTSRNTRQSNSRQDRSIVAGNSASTSRTILRSNSLNRPIEATSTTVVSPRSRRESVSAPPVVRDRRQSDPPVENENNEPANRPQKVVWLFERSFNSTEELNAFLAQDGSWSKLKTETLKKGIKTQYRCNSVKRRGDPCGSGLYTMHGGDPNDPTIKLFRKSTEHTCETSANKVTKTSDPIQRFIIEQYELGNKLQGIMMLIRNRPELRPMPEEKQVKNIIQYHQKKTNLKSDISIGDMKRFVELHKAIPEDIDETFVVATEFSPPETANEEKYFRIFYSTKRLLSHAIMCDALHCDGTYKQIVQGFPILVIGVTDLNKKFHLCGICVAFGETTQDYQFLFNALKSGVIAVTGKELEPKAVIADADRAISAAIPLSYEDNMPVRVNCFFHLMANVEKRSFASAKNKEDIKNDIRALRNSFWFGLRAVF